MVQVLNRAVAAKTTMSTERATSKGERERLVNELRRAKDVQVEAEQCEQEIIDQCERDVKTF